MKHGEKLKCPKCSNDKFYEIFTLEKEPDFEGEYLVSRCTECDEELYGIDWDKNISKHIEKAYIEGELEKL